MDLTFMKTPSCLVVRVSGELDLSSAARFRDLIDNELRKTAAPNVVVNLKNLSFVDSTGLGVILGRHKTVTSWGGKFILSDVAPKVSSMLEMAGLLPVLQVARTEEDAIKRVKGKDAKAEEAKRYEQ
ncbi:MAG TPA: anti-sigma factor antagonist [Firmicutes bacterium]|jgi:stage II sporulation protein AA (anti-sigma F factor antagonist)|nr:anti-sigma factor antagonist [Bacillota bacterium]